MSIENYAELQSALQSYMTRSDSRFVNQCPTFIDNAESRINRKLRANDMEFRAQATMTAGDEYLALPDNFKSMRVMRLVSVNPRRYLTPATPQQMDSAAGRSDSIPPNWYALEGNEIRTGPGVPDNGYTIEMVYTAGVAHLSDSNTSNWLLLRHPDVYLFASLTEAAIWARNWQIKGEYEGLFMQRIEEARLEELNKKHTGAPMRSRPDFPTP